MVFKDNEHYCDLCNNLIIRPKSELTCKNHFCNKICYGKWQSQNREYKKGEEHHRATKTNIICKNCDLEFYPPKKTSKFCSKDCEFEYKQGENHPNYIKEYRTPLICLICNNEFQPNFLYFRDQKYCSKECYGKSMRANNHWNWQGGKTPLNLRLRKSIKMKNWRKTIFERDNYTCQKCFEKGKELHAHHIIPFHWIIENMWTNDLLFNINNGLTVCAPCHREIHFGGGD